MTRLRAFIVNQPWWYWPLFVFCCLVAFAVGLLIGYATINGPIPLDAWPDTLLMLWSVVSQYLP